MDERPPPSPPSDRGSSERTFTRTAPSGTPPAADELYLLILAERSSRVHNLPPGGQVLLGRAAEADVVLEDQGVSRLHARIVTGAGQAVITDLSSHNGTFVNGQQLGGPRTLVAGDAVVIGGVTLVFAARALGGPRSLAVDLGELCRRGAAAVELCVRLQRELAVVVIAVPPAADPQAIAEAVTRARLPVDSVAWGADGELVVLMPEIGADDVVHLAASLLRLVAEIAGEGRAGFATWPQDGGEFAVLTVSARAAARAAAPGAVVAARETYGTVAAGGHTIIVADPLMVQLYALVERLAAADLPVLVCGETGTGKELVAAALHHFSARRDRPFVALNCAAIGETLVQSELFGHQRGAFSDAGAAKPGLLETAAGGTVFLDEIGELPGSVQAKLLRALETKRIIRLGDVRERAIDIRIVAATNHDLQEDVHRGRFREDLFYRLRGAMVWLPPLRDRPRELPILAQAFLRDACLAQGRPPMTIAAAAMQLLEDHAWPGNVRELKNLMSYVAATVGEPALQPWHLESIGGEAERRGPGSPPAGARWILREGAPVAGDAAGPATGDAAAGPAAGDGVTGPPPAPTFRPIAEEVRELEISRIVAALEATGGHQRRAARLIGMPLRTFAARRKQYGIPLHGDDDEA